MSAAKKENKQIGKSLIAIIRVRGSVGVNEGIYN